jgi:hypothetical protein
MKKAIFFFLFVSSLAFAQESSTFSNDGIISLNDGNYNFSIVLVNDLRQTITTWDTADRIPGIPSTKNVKVNGFISTFVTFVTLNNENVNLTYSVRLKKPDGTFSSNEYNDLIIANTRIGKNRFFRGRQLLTIGFDETDTIGKYQFHITIKDNGRIIHNCIMEFELTE